MEKKLGPFKKYLHSPWIIVFLGLIFLGVILKLYTPILSYPEFPLGKITDDQTGKFQYFSDFLNFLQHKFIVYSSNFSLQPRLFLVFLHLLNSLVVYLFSLELVLIFKLEKKNFLFLLLPSFFFFSPLTTENLLWFATLRESFGTLLFLVSALFYLVFLRRDSRWAYLSSVMASVFLVLVNPFFCSIIFFLFFLDYLFKQSPLRDRLWRFIPFVFIFLLYYNFSISFYTWFSKLFRYDLSFSDHLFSRVTALGFSIFKIILPYDSFFDYLLSPVRIIKNSNFFFYLGFLLFWITLLGLAFYFQKNKRWALLLLAFFFPIVFDLRFLTFSYEAYTSLREEILTRSFVADRYLYLPLALFLIFLAPYLGRLVQRKTQIFIFSLGIFVLVFFYIPTTLKNFSYWANPMDFITKNYDVKTFPPKALVGLGNAFYDVGLKNDSIVFFKEAEKKDPTLSETLLPLLEHYKKESLFAEAFNLFNAKDKNKTPISVSSFLEMTHIFLKAGEIFLAEMTLKRGLMIHKGDSFLLKSYNEILRKKMIQERISLELLALDALLLQQRESAENYIKKLIAFSPDHPQNATWQMKLKALKENKNPQHRERINGPPKQNQQHP